MSIVAIIFSVLLVVSGIGLIVFVLLHSGKGTGVSDMIASSVYNNQSGSSIMEKNLNRITIILAAVFLISLIVLMVVYTQGTIGYYLSNGSLKGDATASPFFFENKYLQRETLSALRVHASAAYAFGVSCLLI